MPRLWYFPIEDYQERYSCYLSSEDGFWETFLKQNNIEHVSLRPDISSLYEGNRIRLGKGSVLDTSRRCVWAMRQVEMFLKAIDLGDVHEGDVVYIEDFWHPGIEALPYARSLYKLDFKIYSWCHAQSWDESDFLALAGTTEWIRPFELGIAKSMEGIFVADAGLKELMIKAGVTVPIYAVGTAWNTKWILNKYMPVVGGQRRDKIVVYASRWDTEKNPGFYCSLARMVLRERKDVQFAVTTGFQELVSNDPHLVVEAYDVVSDHPDHFHIHTNVTKADYFGLLRGSAVHFNCAWHDWVSYGLCESLTFGCQPLFPNHKSFPLALQFDLDHLYDYMNLADAKKKLYGLLDGPEKNISYLLNRFDNTIPYVAHTMGVYNP